MKVIVGFTSIEDFKKVHKRYHGKYDSRNDFKFKTMHGVGIWATPSLTGATYTSDNWWAYIKTGDTIVLAEDELKDRYYSNQDAILFLESAIEYAKNDDLENFEATTEFLPGGVNKITFSFNAYTRKPDADL